MLCFTSTVRRATLISASSDVQAAGGVGVIIAKNPGDNLAACSNDFPCVEVDYEIGTRILYYIRSTRYLIVLFVILAFKITIIRSLYHPHPLNCDCLFGGSQASCSKSQPF